MAKPPAIDQETLKIMERMLRMPPKPHAEMKVGKAKPTKRTAGKGRARVGKSKS